MDCRRFHHHYHYYKSHAWCDWSLEVVGFRAELTFGAFTYVKVCIFGNFLCACEKSQGWQFFVFIVKFAIFCKPGEFLNSLQFFAIFPLLYKIYENCEKSQGWWFFVIICDFCSSLLCCSSSWKPDMDFTRSSWFYQFCEKSQGQWFSDLPHFHFLLQILQFLQLRANLDMSSFCRCQNKVGNCMVG